MMLAISALSPIVQTKRVKFSYLAAVFTSLTFFSSTGLASNDNSALAEKPSRIYQKCEALLGEPTPYLFAISRGHKTALVIGTTDDQSVYLLPDYAKQAIESSAIVLNAQGLSRKILMGIGEDFENAMQHSADTQLVKKLEGLGNAFIRFMVLTGGDRENLRDLPASMAISILYDYSKTMTSGTSPEREELKQKLSLALGELDPAPSELDFWKFKSEMLLGHGVNVLARTAGAGIHPYFGGELGKDDLQRLRSIELLRELVESLLRIERSQFRLVDMQLTPMDQIHESYDHRQKFLPNTLVDIYSLSSNEVMGIVQKFIQERRLLVNIDMDFLPGKRGLLKSLERRGFSVKRIESPEDWQNTKSEFVK